MTKTYSPSVDPDAERVSVVLRGLLAGTKNDDHISVGYIIEVFGVRGFALLLLVLGLLNIVIFMVPLISMLFGIPMIIFSVQIILGYRTPAVPAFIRNRTVPRVRLVQGLGRAISWVEKIERYIRPRLSLISSPFVLRIHGCLALFLSILVAVPVPLFNLPPSLGVAMLAIGVLQRDGVFIISAYVIALWCLYLFKSLVHFL